jgi:hypothetical protein
MKPPRFRLKVARARPLPRTRRAGRRQLLLDAQPHAGLQPRERKVAVGVPLHGHGKREAGRVAAARERLEHGAAVGLELKAQHARDLVVRLAWGEGWGGRAGGRAGGQAGGRAGGRAGRSEGGFGQGRWRRARRASRRTPRATLTTQPGAQAQRAPPPPPPWLTQRVVQGGAQLQVVPHAAHQHQQVVAARHEQA